jgi:HK97 family phage portal protein
MLYGVNKDGDTYKANRHPLYRVLHDNANPQTSSQQFREFLMREILFRGNGYAYIERNEDYEVVNLWQLPSDTVQPIRLDDGSYIYQVQGFDRPLSADLIFHVSGMQLLDGVIGKSVIESHAQELGIAVASAKYASKFYNSGCSLSGVVTTEQALDPEVKKALSEAWEKNYSGVVNSHKTPFLSHGLKYSPMGLSPEESQLLESRKLSAIEVCRMFRIPEVLVNVSDRATWSNLEIFNTSYVQYTLARWVHRFENEANKKLLTEADKRAGFYSEFLVDSLLRGDWTTKTKNYKELIYMGVISPKTVAQRENLPSAGVSDKCLVPVNMQASEQLGQPQEQPKETKNSIRNSQTKEQKRQKYRVLIEDACNRCNTKETNAISRLAKKCLPDNQDQFVTESADFIENHSDCVRSSFRPVLLTYSVKKTDRILHNIVEHLKNDSLDSLANALTKPEPHKAVEGVLEKWKTRPINIGESFCRGDFE